jgi:hypothetical protein
MPDHGFARYKQATLALLGLTADRLSLGTGGHPTVARLAAIDQADAALALAVDELDAARQNYLHDPDAIY